VKKDLDVLIADVARMNWVEVLKSISVGLCHCMSVKVLKGHI